MTSPDNIVNAQIEHAFDSDPVALAANWLAEFDEIEDSESRIKRLAFRVNTGETFLRGQSSWSHNGMANRALELCRVWDPESEDVPQWSRFAFVATRTLSTYSRLMTTRYNNFADELKTIEAKGFPYAEEFGARAFDIMKSLDPDIALASDMLDQTLRDVLDRPEYSHSIQRAGIGLAYALAKATQEPELSPGLLR